MRAALPLLLLCLAWIALPASGADPPPASAEGIIELRLNDQEESTTVIARRGADGSLLLQSADLEALRLARPAAEPRIIEGGAYYAFGPETGAAVEFDTATQSARVTLPPGAFVGTYRSAGPGDMPRAGIARIGGFLNYDLLFQDAGQESETGGIAELGVFGNLGVVTNSVIARDADSDSGVVRLDSTWTRDFPDQLATLRVGDAISTSGAWGRSVRFGGVQFATNFQTQPTLVTTPLLMASGQAVVPSTVDVFVNGQQVASQSVPPGPFTIDQLPTITGSGELQVVVTDALGRQQVLTEPYYTGPALLAEGLSEYSVDLGTIREDYGLRSNAYDSFVAAGTFRHGFTDGFTAEVHAEAEGGGATALGADAALQLGPVGILSLTAAAGGDDEGTGWLGGAGFERNGGRMSFFARSQFASESFAQLGTLSGQPRPKLRNFAGIGFGLERFGSVQLGYGTQSYWSGPDTTTVSLSHSLSLGSGGFLNFIATHSNGVQSDTSLMLAWTMSVGGRRTANVSLLREPDENDQDEAYAVASLQQSLPPGPGTGYLLSIASNDEADLGYAYKGRSGQVSLDYARHNDAEGWRAEASGGLAFTAAGVMPARRLDQSFAVIQVADYADMTVYLDNQPVGRTDAQGRVLLDALRAYERNEVSIDPVELPMDATLTVAQIDVTPAYRSGEVVAFPVKRSRAATLRLFREDGSPVPPGARVRLGAGSYPVALGGLVFFDDLGAEREASVEWPGARCRFELARELPAGAIADLGAVTCSADPGP